MDQGGPPFSAKRVLLVGGGRWGRVHAGILRRVLPVDAEVTWVSAYNRGSLAQLKSEWADKGARFHILADLDEALAVGQDAAIIVSAPHMHAAHTRATLQANIPTLVEKPFVTSSEDAGELLRMAEERGLLLGVGLHLLFTSYLHRFREVSSDRHVRSVEVEWCDPENEVRYGERKSLNVSVQKTHDVFSHVWAIIHVFFPNSPMVVSCISVGRRASTEIKLDVAGTEVIARIDRRAQRRKRRLALVFAAGGSAELDFTTEPGLVTLDGMVSLADTDWASQPSPLTTEIRSFLAALDNPADAANWPGRARVVISGVRLAEEIAQRVLESEARTLAEAFVRQDLIEADVRAIISDNVGPDLMELGTRGVEAESTIEAIVSAFMKRETNEIFGDLRTLHQHSMFLQMVSAGIT